MPVRLVLFGGSFNPIHFGHLISARAVAEQLGVDKVVLIPAAAPPHKVMAELAPATARLDMVRLAVAGDSLFEVNDLELKRAGPSYTFATVTEFRDRHGASAALHWIIGADTLPELATWYRVGELVQIVRIVTVVRPGHALADVSRLAPLEAKIGRDALNQILAGRLTTPAIDISATDVRRRVASGMSIRFLTADAVVEYIASARLYANDRGPQVAMSR